MSERGAITGERAAKLESSEIYRAVARPSADADKSLLGQVRCVVSEPSLREAALARLQHLPSRQSGTGLADAAAVKVPLSWLLLVHYIRDLYSNNTIMLLNGNWSDHTGAARAA
jgi:hypothetical protein